MYEIYIYINNTTSVSFSAAPWGRGAHLERLRQILDTRPARRP